jgi:hypothetical protein
MPVALPLIISGITAAIGGTELGMNLAGVGLPSPGDAAKQEQAAQLKQAQADAAAKQKMLLASLPNAQEQGGGALNAPSLTDLAAVIAGLPGEANTGVGRGALSSFLGTGPGTGGTTTNTGSNPETMVGATFGLSGSQG